MEPFYLRASSGQTGNMSPHTVVSGIVANSPAEQHRIGRRTPAFLAGSFVFLLLSIGCAFDVVQVKQLPVTLTATLPAPKAFLLDAGAKVTIGTGFAVNLRANTTWQEIGTTQFGEVYSTKDQVLTVEASNVYEAALVVRDGQVTGFYLLIEKKFCPATQPVALATTPQ